MDSVFTINNHQSLISPEHLSQSHRTEIEEELVSSPEGNEDSSDSSSYMSEEEEEEHADEYVPGIISFLQ